jgi:hypothetical protein
LACAVTNDPSPTGHHRSSVTTEPSAAPSLQHGAGCFFARGRQRMTSPEASATSATMSTGSWDPPAPTPPASRSWQRSWHTTNSRNVLLIGRPSDGAPASSSGRQMICSATLYRSHEGVAEKLVPRWPGVDRGRVGGASSCRRRNMRSQAWCPVQDGVNANKEFAKLLGSCLPTCGRRCAQPQQEEHGALCARLFPLVLPQVSS